MAKYEKYDLWFEPAIALEAEGARIGLTNCKVCGAAVLLDSRDTINYARLHGEWHEMDRTGDGVVSDKPLIHRLHHCSKHPKEYLSSSYLGVLTGKAAEHIEQLYVENKRLQTEVERLHKEHDEVYAMLSAASKSTAHDDYLIDLATEISKQVERLKGKVFEAIGWTHAWACSMLDNGNDPRKADCAELLVKAKEQLQLVDTPEAGDEA